jgi:hypothetical protein
VSAVHDYLAADHDRLDALLARAGADPSRVDLEPYEEFRRGLLRHVGMEEMILIPAARAARGGQPPELFQRVRLDHGALTALLIPTPTPAVLAALRAILGPHNALEERDGGLYEDCASAAGDEAGLLARLKGLRDIPPAAHADGPHVTASVRRALDAAGYADISVT